MPGTLPEVRIFRLDLQHEAVPCHEHGEWPAPRWPEPESWNPVKPGLATVKRPATSRATSRWAKFR